VFVEFESSYSKEQWFMLHPEWQSHQKGPKKNQETWDVASWQQFWPKQQKKNKGKKRAQWWADRQGKDTRIPRTPTTPPGAFEPPSPSFNVSSCCLLFS